MSKQITSAAIASALMVIRMDAFLAPLSASIGREGETKPAAREMGNGAEFLIRNRYQ